MDQQRLKAYLNLIQDLLTCPSGEEWIRLRKHEGLVNSELVQVMEQVAAQMALQGDAKSARFLHNWAAQLHHIVTGPAPPPTPEDEKIQAYLNLIQALLQCSEGQEERILQAHQELMGPGLVQVMKEVAAQLSNQGDPDSARYLLTLANHIGQAWMAAHAFRPEYRKDYPEEQDSLKEAEAGTIPVGRDSATPVPFSEPVSTPPAVVLTPPRQTPAAAAMVISPPQERLYEQVEQQLGAIAHALDHLATVLETRPPTANPLWYMDTLEKAHTNGWILTTEEVEQLIGVKPHCNANADTFHRGGWNFVKAGRLGAQNGWQVVKATASEG